MDTGNRGLTILVCAIWLLMLAWAVAWLTY